MTAPSSTLEKLLSIPYEAPLAANPPLTPVSLRLYPIFDPLRKDPRFGNYRRSPVLYVALRCLKKPQRDRQEPKGATRIENRPNKRLVTDGSECAFF